MELHNEMYEVEGLEIGGSVGNDLPGITCRIGLLLKVFPPLYLI